MQEILFSNPIMFPCVKTTSMYSLQSFSNARMMRSRVRISWLIGFSKAQSRAFLLACSCSTWLFSADISCSRYPHTASTDKCSARTWRSSALADSSSRPLPSFFDSSLYKNSLRSDTVFSRIVRSVLAASSFCAFSERAAISMLSFLMNQVFSSRYFRISVLERSYLSIIFLDLSYFSFSQSAIFSKLSRSSSNFFLSVSISFSFCCTLVRSTASFFYPSASCPLRFSTSGLVVLDSMLRIWSSTFFSSVKLVTSCVFSPNYFSNLSVFSCRALVSREKSSVCCLSVVNISLQFSSLARRVLSSASYLRTCYCSSLDSPPPSPFARSRMSSLVSWILASLPSTSLVSVFISYRSSPSVNSSSSSLSPLPCASVLRASCSLMYAATLSLLSAAISAISWMLAAIYVKFLRYSSISLGLRNETSTDFLRLRSSSQLFLEMASLRRLNIQIYKSPEMHEAIHE